MTTKILFEDKTPELVSLSTLAIGDSFLWHNKIYLKLRTGKLLRIKGDREFSDFELATMNSDNLVEPVHAEFKFFTK